MPPAVVPAVAAPGAPLGSPPAAQPCAAAAPAAAADRAPSRRDALSRLQNRRRLVAAALAVVAAAALATTRPAAADSLALMTALRIAGMAAITVGVLGRVWASLFIGDRKLREVVREGPYAAMRHPLYVFTALCVAGVGLFHGSAALAAALAAVTLGGFRLVAAREEAMLLDRFGPAYDAYRRAVPAFLPLGRRAAPGSPAAQAPRPAARAVSLAPVLRAMRETALYFLAPPVLMLAEGLRASGALPTLFVLP
jgi:protein-S-isoprenylcysteine O-methyltransferase Ste14